jgi:formamidopyrimidine-DNA glycosylase
VPELAEVEYYRKRWDAGLGQRVERVTLHREKRIFRKSSPAAIKRLLSGSTLLGSEARGKQLLFSFSGGAWLGLHLGMSGEMRVEAKKFVADKHDHLVLFQRRQALVFSDPRQFGLIRFHHGPEAPAWWAELPPALSSREFTSQKMAAFLQRHGRLAIKSALLLQRGFPGIGNWMADEVLWRAKVDPRRRAGALSTDENMRLWRSLRHVSRGALRHVSLDFSDPPRGWLFHERWGRGGRCPIHRTALQREFIGGRATAWCAQCQQ